MFCNDSYVLHIFGLVYLCESYMCARPWWVCSMRYATPMQPHPSFPPPPLPTLRRCPVWKWPNYWRNGYYTIATRKLVSTIHAYFLLVCICGHIHITVICLIFVCLNSTFKFSSEYILSNHVSTRAWLLLKFLIFKIFILYVFVVIQNNENCSWRKSKLQSMYVSCV